MVTVIKSPRAQRWLVAMVVGGLLIFFLALSFLMVPYSRVIEDNNGEDLTCLQIPFTRSRAAKIIDTYNEEASAAARSLHLPGDLIFPIGYALLYSGLIGLIVRHQEGRWLHLGLIVMFFPFVAMVLDWIENLFILRMITISTEQSTAAIPAWMPALGGIVGTSKYLFLSVLTPLFGIASIIRSLVSRRPALTPALGVTYVFGLAMLGFSLFQLITDVVPCLSSAL